MGNKMPWILGAGAIAGGLTLRWAAQKMSVAPLMPADEELIKDLPGNDIIDPDEVKMHAGRAITINVPP